MHAHAVPATPPVVVRKRCWTHTHCWAAHAAPVEVCNSKCVRMCVCACARVCVCVYLAGGNRTCSLRNGTYNMLRWHSECMPQRWGTETSARAYHFSALPPLA
eukprot:1048196-Pelagomonas_calceolata.AAC.10